MCRRGGGRGGGGGSSSLRLNWGAGRGDLQHKLLSSRRGSPQPRLSPLTPHPWPEGWGREGGGSWAVKSSENVNSQSPHTERLSPESFFCVFLLEQIQTDDADMQIVFFFAHMHTNTLYVCLLRGGTFFLIILVFLRENCVSYLFRPVGRSGGEYHQSFRDLARDHRLTRRSCLGGGGGGHGFEPWTMGGETERWREGKMEADKKVREGGMEGRKGGEGTEMGRGWAWGVKK